MEFIRNRMRPEHCDTVRQQGICAAHPSSQRTMNSSIKMNHLFQCMHTCVGAPRRDNRDRFTGNPAQRFLQCVLHSLPICLALPAVERTTIVLYTQCDPHRMVITNISNALPSNSTSPNMKRHTGNSINILVGQLAI